MTTTTQETQVLHMDNALPTLHIPYPQCGHCGEDVTIEDGVASCEGCRVMFDRIEDGAGSKPDDMLEGTDVACEIVAGKQMPPHDDRRGYHYVPSAPKPCILPSGHESDHLNPYDVEVSNA